ncbi:MAG: hypothetical protein HZB19_04785 [Chloroflexi bacterium]|nr:hypothetical protein [Chloroflexota bacterium]
MLKRTIPVLVTLAVLLTACGPEATPTMNPADVQGTAVAAAWTMVAMTQEAIPTATPLPPTETPSPTPLPSFTPVSLPTSAETPTQNPLVLAPTSTTSADPCNAPVSANADGPKVFVRLVNKTKGSVNVSMWLTEITPFGECGYYGTSIAKGGSQNIDVLAGCYGLYAWVNDPNKPSTSSGPGFCVHGTDKITIEISADTFKVVYP